MTATTRTPPKDPSRPRLRRATGRALRTTALGLATALVLTGSVGSYRYLRAFWRYRAFPPPAHPAFVQLPGTTTRVAVGQGSVQQLVVQSAAVDGRKQAFYVFLPAGYATDTTRRYPVLYLLHGFPGQATSYLSVGGGAVQEDVLVAQRKMQPLILVLPAGPWLTDTEWANGVQPGTAWETFIARDVVAQVDAKFRTINCGCARGIGGLSEGGYAALNIALHHPNEFSFVESWSGYQFADNLPRVFGSDPSVRAYNSPALYVRTIAPTLRRLHTYFWFYIGSSDSLAPQNVRFASELTSLGVAHQFFLTGGGHQWALWRRYTADALIVASEHLAHASA